MIALLIGKLAEVREETIIVIVNDVGYRVCVPSSVFYRSYQPGDEITLYTHLYVREDELSLYGFQSEDEKELFLHIISVSRIGPRLALAVLSELSVSEFRTAVIKEDLSRLSKIRGIGRKTAQRLVLELKEKLEAAGDFTEDYPSRGEYPEIKADAVDAMVNLGYAQSEAEHLVSEAYEVLQEEENGEVNLEKLIKAALARAGTSKN